jgi:PTS system ascorbate-specific IIC component
VFIFPSLITGFFESGVAGVFANKYGGWKAALVTGLVSGLICSLGTFLLLPLFPQLAGTGTMFCDSDAGFILAPFFWICRGIASVLGVAVSL